jgi:hypothetical protein
MGVFAAIFAALVLSSCGGGGTNSSAPTPQNQASIYMVGTDAPLPSVISCEVTVTGITLNNGSTNVSVLSQPEVVDFAQLSGLHRLLDGDDRERHKLHPLERPVCFARDTADLDSSGGIHTDESSDRAAGDGGAFRGRTRVITIHNCHTTS